MANRAQRFDWITPDVVRNHSVGLSEEHIAALNAGLKGTYLAGAADLKLNIGTFKSRLNRARVALRAKVPVETPKEA